MPIPEIVFGEQSRAGMLRGLNKLAKLLAITLGPVGGSIVSAMDGHRDPEMLNDAATIARRMIQLPNRIEDAGAMTLRHMVWRVREEVGDGSATTAVLAQALAGEMHKVVMAGANPMLVKKGIERATEAALIALDKMSEPLEGEERITAVASAATGNNEIAKLLGEIYDVLGPNANIVIEPYVHTKHDRAYHEGARFKAGYVSPYLLTDEVHRTATLDDPYVVVVGYALDTVESVHNILEQVLRAGGKSVLIVADNMSDKAIGVLVANNEAGTIKSVAAKLKPYGDELRGTVEDLALIVGAKPLFDTMFTGANQIDISQMGRADRIIVDPDCTTIIGGHGDKAAIRERQQSLRKRVTSTTNADERDTLRRLLVHFSSGVGELRLGALVERDRDALKIVAEQAITAVRSGIESGIVPGGGVAYLNCIPAVLAVQAEGDEAFGVQIVAHALEVPMRCIISNSGLHAPLAISDAQRLGPGYGFDVREKKIVKMVDAGIVDPTLVVKRALQLAASGVMMLLTTDTLVLHKDPKENYKP